MARRVDGVAQVMASLSRAVGTALDPSSILARTVAALDPVLPLGRVSLWRATRTEMEPVACHPPLASSELLDLDREEGAPGAVTLQVGTRSTPLGRLVVLSATGERPDDDQRALLDLAANQADLDPEQRLHMLERSPVGLLVDNAIKFGGVAELSTRMEDGRWLVEVRDRGPGFADDIRNTAFEMFARSQTAAAVPGLGVGLAIARTLVEVLDGSVTVEDAAPGPGAIARISLPA